MPVNTTGNNPASSKNFRHSLISPASRISEQIYVKDQVEQALQKYHQRPDEQMFSQLWNYATETSQQKQILARLYQATLSQKADSPLRHLILLLFNEERYLEANYFCRLLCEREPHNIDAYRFLCIIASFRSDPFTANAALAELEKLSAPEPVLLMARLAFLLLSGQSLKAVPVAERVLTISQQDPFSGDLVVQVALQSWNSDLLIRLLVEKCYEPQLGRNQANDAKKLILSRLAGILRHRAELLTLNEAR